MDLHDICLAYGNENVAEVLGMTLRCLTDIRRGHTAMTVDDFFELEQKYPHFDVVKTLRKLGRVRENKERSRKFRQSRNPKETTK